MITQLIDRRQNANKKNTVNRQRFLRRCKSQIRRAVSKVVGERNITDIDKGEQITIPAKDIVEPRFNRGEGGHNHHILPGNEEFTPGDHIKRPTADSSGNGHNGTVYGAKLTTDRHGISNSAYSFNGTSDYILIPSGLGGPGLDIRESISIISVEMQPVNTPGVDKVCIIAVRCIRRQ